MAAYSGPGTEPIAAVTAVSCKFPHTGSRTTNSIASYLPTPLQKYIGRADRQTTLYAVIQSC